MAGVIGSKQFTFDLWGDTVTVAHRMEAHAQPGRTRARSTVYEMLRDRYVFAHAGTVACKGIGDLTACIIDSLLNIVPRR